MTKINKEFEGILIAAHEAARQAQQGMVEGQGLDCGFAWVTITGNHPLARYCRARLKQIQAEQPSMMSVPYEFAIQYGSKGQSGWQWWKPGRYPGQSIGIHEAGARAFRQVLAHHNISAEVNSRFD